MPKKSIINMWFDGCCEPVNPGGHSSFGVIIIKDNNIILKESGYCGHGINSSNNVAEYSGFIRGLEFLIENKLNKKSIFIRSDSNLVIQQQFGTWKIKQGIYVPLAYKAKELIKQFNKIKAEWIPREENNMCDVLSKKVLIEMGIKFKIQHIEIEKYHGLN